MKRIDVTGDGNVSREDYELIGIRLAKYGGMSKKKAEETRVAFLRVADQLGLHPGVRIPVEEAAVNASNSLLNMKGKEKEESLALCGIMYDLIDADEDGYISLPEFKAFFQSMGPEINDEKVKWCFDTLDFNKNGRISRDEFMKAADDFMHGVEESPIANAFYGDLVD